MKADGFESCRRLTFQPPGKQLDPGISRSQGADHLLHVDRATLVAKNRHSQIGTNVSYPHLPISEWLPERVAGPKLWSPHVVGWLPERVPCGAPWCGGCQTRSR